MLPLYNGNSDVRLHAGHLDGDNYDLHGIIGNDVDEGSSLSCS